MKSDNESKLNFVEIKDWSKVLITIDNLWDNLLFAGKITLEERIRVKSLSHVDQQLELEKYK